MIGERTRMPLLHLVAACVPAGRGMAQEAERQARLAADAAANLDYGQERIWAAMAQALACQAAGDYPGMARALNGYLADVARSDVEPTGSAAGSPMLTMAKWPPSKLASRSVTLSRPSTHTASR